ncbi:hypothetical protein V1511DRAFT_491894 [Dipodascopsis uninucleata]
MMDSRPSMEPSASLLQQKTNETPEPVSKQHHQPQGLDLIASPGSSALAHTPGSVGSVPLSSDGDGASQSPDDTSSGPHNRQRKIACIECRQQKVKCDAFERAPGACTRCAKRKLRCSIKSDFKRTYKRARMAEIEKEVEQLRRSLDVQSSEQDLVSRTLLDLARGNSTSGSSTPLQTTSENENLLQSSKSEIDEFDDSSNRLVGMINNGSNTVNNDVNPGSNSNKRKRSSSNKSIYSASFSTERMFNPSLHVITARTLEGFTVQKEQIVGLFLEFQTHYHKFLPVIDLSKGPDFIYNRSEILFWIILETSSRIHTDNTLFPILSSKVRDLVARQLNQPLRTVYDVQAILIYTLWPPPAGSLNSDPCWNACGLAMFNAVKLGFHCPGKTQDFGRVKVSPTLDEIQEQIKTWVSCNITSQFLSMALGYPAFTLYEWTVQSAINGQSFVAMPDGLRVQVQLAQFCDKMVRLLSRNVADICGNVDTFSRRSTIPVLLKELDELELKIGSTSDVNKLVSHITRVQLLSYAFLDDEPEQSSELLYLAYQASISTISLVESMDESIGPDGSCSTLLYLPLFMQLGIVLASFVILKLQFSALSEKLDISSGKRHFACAIALLRKMSFKDSDFPIRVSTIMFQSWKLHVLDQMEAVKEGKDKYITPKLKLRSRMAVSVFYDSIWVWRERYGTFHTPPTNSNNNQQHLATVLHLQQQRRYQNQQQRQQQSKVTSPRLQAREGPVPELRNTRGVMALLDSNNSAYGPSFEQQQKLPYSIESISLSSTSVQNQGSKFAGQDSLDNATPSDSVLDATSKEPPAQQQPPSFLSQQHQLPSMDTDDLIGFLDNDSVAFDHLYLDSNEIGVLWDDISIFIDPPPDPEGLHMVSESDRLIAS